ncbi:MAG: (Fe-S)-binding protein [Desulfobacteraceae bacterium]|nr:(Fe-S)-binding protein [Desulfobacteraceae bacterium]
MADIEEISRLIRELEDQLVVCMKCGMCQSVCPVFDRTGREADVARGKLALLDGLMRSLFEDPEGVYQRLNKCLLCGSCAANCPSGVNVLEIFIKARAILTGYMGLSPAKRLVLRGMLSHPGLLDRMAEWGARFQRLFTRPVNEVVGTSCARVMSPLLQGRHFRSLARTPFHRRLPSLDRPAGASGLRVAFFTGCLIDKLFPDVATAAVRVLEQARVGIFLPEGQGCCGIPAVSSGDVTTFRRLLAHNVRLFAAGGFDHMVTACATCTATIREVWPMMAGEGLREAASQLAEKTLDISQFLGRYGLIPPAVDTGGGATVATYHDPCHLKKSLKVWYEPRDLIRASGGFRLVEMNEPDWCCGMGGSFNLQYYEISQSIGRRKVDNIQRTGASVLATSCPACMVQISDMLSRAGARIAVKHPVEIFAATIGNA